MTTPVASETFTEKTEKAVIKTSLYTREERVHLSVQFNALAETLRAHGVEVTTKCDPDYEFFNFASVTSQLFWNVADHRSWKRTDPMREEFIAKVRELMTLGKKEEQTWNIRHG